MSDKAEWRGYGIKKKDGGLRFKRRKSYKYSNRYPILAGKIEEASEICKEGEQPVKIIVREE
jgi:hypothetical protein